MNETDWSQHDLSDYDYDRYKANPEIVASKLAWQTSSKILNIIMDNNGVPNGRLIAIAIDAALHNYHDPKEQTR